MISVPSPTRNSNRYQFTQTPKYELIKKRPEVQTIKPVTDKSEIVDLINNIETFQSSNKADGRKMAETQL